jgi:dephospho-CoA kinase
MAAYSQFKMTLAEHVDDLDSYSDIKDPVVDLVVAAAAAWAGDSGWQPHGGQPS